MVNQDLLGVKMMNEVLNTKFNHLEKEMKENYFWCKVKLHSYALILLLLVVYLR